MMFRSGERMVAIALGGALTAASFGGTAYAQTPAPGDTPIAVPTSHPEPTAFPVFDLEAGVWELTTVIEDLEDGTTTEANSTEVDMTLRSDVLFGKDSAVIRPEARAALANVASELDSRTPGKVTITGYTDDLGSEEHGYRLSEQRAEAVRGELESSLARHQVTTEGKGEEDPAYPNDSEENRAKNRRVVIGWVAG